MLVVVFAIHTVHSAPQKGTPQLSNYGKGRQQDAIHLDHGRNNGDYHDAIYLDRGRFIPENVHLKKLQQPIDPGFGVQPIKNIKH